ncbi:MAG: MmgE/PrpD family protein [Gulosibacter sp.]|uniref:MmgE/PrpD family protein n=1 Tax=Gulosibacter sp. TaxID=2817531 RepID=UPI003F9215F4
MSLTTAEALAQWAHSLTPTDTDLALAQRSLVDTMAVTLAARNNALVPISAQLGEAGHWAATGHVLDFDDLHMESTTHISVVIVPATLATGGDARAYLAGAGVMARLGNALGWTHYQSAWHATCTAGAPAAAVAASIALGLSVDETAHAIALSIPAAGGVQQAFGTVGKPLQVGFAADAGVRAARLAQAGARSDLRVVDEWLGKVNATGPVQLDGPAIPDGLAIKLFPCCYAMQRPIGVMRALAARVDVDEVEGINVTTPRGTVKPLIHSRPTTGLEGKFSLEYSLVAVLLDGYPDFESFTDAQVQRPLAQELIRKVHPKFTEEPIDNLLDGDCTVEITLRDGSAVAETLALPPGSPGLPPTEGEIAGKLEACGADVPELLAEISWAAAAGLLRAQLPAQA